ncbi:peptide chain release factor N(5)-glutamine methyltransferase [Dongia sp. agr-C8]
MTVGEALAQAVIRLGAVGIDRPQAEARILLEVAGGRGRGQIIAFPEHALTSAQCDAFDALVARRCAREPISRILGSREFWSLRFAVGPATLDPRPDSETLVEAVLGRIPDRNVEISLVDLGTGTGCLLLALLSELPRAKGLGIDISADACDIAAANAATLGLDARADFRTGDWLRGISAQFDVILSNPPYIESTAINGLEPEVAKFDPHRALDGGVDGLSAYRALLPQATAHLNPGGFLVLEIGAGQGKAVSDLAEHAGLTAAGSVNDLAGIERCLLFSR